MSDKQTVAPGHFRTRRSRPGSRIVALVFVLAFFSLSSAQPQPLGKVQPPSDSRGQAGGRHDSDETGQIGSREEMLRNVEVRRREAIYKENLERAKEGAQLGAELRDAYQKQKSLGQAEFKKLGRLEKLAKSIRNDNGGDDDDEALKETPKDMLDALSRLAQMSDDLRKRVEKTPKHVVSSAVINCANQVLVLVRLIRAFGG